MTLKSTATALALLVLAVPPALAQTAKMIENFGSWAAYSYDTGSGKNCYVLSAPANSAPENVNHGDNFFMISQKPGDEKSLEPQAMMGYPLKESSKVDVEIDGQKFTLFTRDNTAWVEDASKEPDLISAMKAGISMQVKATSQRGTNTTYDFSLKGVTAALNKIQECK